MEEVYVSLHERLGSYLLGSQCQELREEALKIDAVEAVIRLPSKPEYMQEVAVLFYLHDLKIEEIHAELGLPEGTVKRKLSEAREFLRKEFGIGSKVDYESE